MTKSTAYRAATSASSAVAATPASWWTSSTFVGHSSQPRSCGEAKSIAGHRPDVKSR